MEDGITTYNLSNNYLVDFFPGVDGEGVYVSTWVRIKVAERMFRGLPIHYLYPKRHHMRATDMTVVGFLNELITTEVEMK